jgi:hypothetical protein
MKTLAAAVVLGLAGWTGAAGQSCGNHPLTVQLLAQGSVPAGTVTVSNDAATLHVTFTATGAWTFSQLDVAVGATLSDIPQTAGQPNTSQFPYRRSFSPATAGFTFDIPLGSTVIGSSVFIAAHASAGLPCQAKKDAWGAGQLFPGSPACQASGGGHEGDDDDDDHHEGGDRAARLGPTGHDDHGGGEGCSDEHDHGDSSAFRRGSSSSRGDDEPCGGEHGDRTRSLRRGAGHSGHSGNDGHDGHDDEGCGSTSTPCGATYFVYVVNCMVE